MLSNITESFKNISNSWIGVLVAVVVVYKIINTILLRYHAKKLGCKPFYSQPSDGCYGFKTAKQLIEKKRTGMFAYFSHERFETAIGDTAKVYIAMTKWVNTREPENVKAILGTQFNDFELGIRHKHFYPLLGDGIFTLDGHGWKDSRAMLRPQFAREQVAHVKMLEPHVQNLVAHMKKYNGLPFDLQQFFFKLTLDSATEFLFGESVESLRDASINKYPTGQCDPVLKLKFAKSFNDAQMVLATKTVLNTFAFLYNPASFKEDCKVVHDLTDFFVHKALSTSTDELEEKLHGGYIFLYELVKQTRDPRVLRDQALNILLAGRDTTAGLLSFTIFELARNPQYWQRLKDEIKQVFGVGEDARIDEISFEALKKCEFLKAVINEALRLYPSVPSNFRYANKNTSLPRGGGPDGNSPVFIPKGGVVSYTVFSMHRMTKYYGKDALEFRPDRWFEESTKKLGWAYLPFNGGPRICLGQQFALTEASYVITRIVQIFDDLKSVDTEYPPKLNSQLTMCLEDGCNIQIR